MVAFGSFDMLGVLIFAFLGALILELLVGSFVLDVFWGVLFGA